MARKTASRQEMRKQVEAAESREATGDGTPRKKKKAKAAAKKAAPRRKRTREKEPQRKRLVWGVYNAAMKEEARFPYEQRDEADQKVDQLHKKTGKLYFIQPIKEPIADALPPASAAEAKSDASQAEKPKSGR